MKNNLYRIKCNKIICSVLPRKFYFLNISKVTGRKRDLMLQTNLKSNL